ncbi:MAG: hypothetical protein Q4C70_06960 [Planctomycetia bacterium]|nr:hypothetical protein [Planctomycetia bacterium]
MSEILSMYGLQSEGEMVAESFADYMTNGVNAKDLSKKVVALWKKYARGVK